MSNAVRPGARLDWGEEQLRYRILRTVYERAGARCDRPVTGSTIGAALDLPYEDLFRVVAFLDRNGFLHSSATDRRICITPDGIHYIDKIARRRRSVRTPDPRRRVAGAPMRRFEARGVQS